jgi:type IV secretion system protein VirD4
MTTMTNRSAALPFASALLLAVVCLWSATQWAAAMLGNQAALGPAWINVLGWPVYAPWKLFSWWLAFDAQALSVFERAGTVAALGGMLSGAVAIGGAAQRQSRAKQSPTYGSARWADARDIAQSGLFADRGIVLGLYGNRYLRHDGPEHVLAVAPTRSGKGVGIVVPTLMTWTGSVVVHDVKGENWALTAGWRAQTSHCLLFDPTNPLSACFNPLLEVRKGLMEVRDVQNIADILVDPEGARERRDHWEKTAHALLVGAILHVLYAEPEKTLTRVATLLADPSRSIDRVLKTMLTTNHIGTDDAPQVHPVVASVARELLNKSDNERSGVVSTAMSFLGLYRDPVIAANTARSDWRIADLITAERPVSLYLVVPPSDISRTRPLVRLILNQIGRRLTESPRDRDDAQHQHQLLLMLDEFPALGRLDFFETALAFLAGYGIRAVLIAQSLHQIDKAYGPNHAILDNCHVRLAFAPNDERTAKRLSDALGTATQLRAQRNFSGQRLAAWLPHTSISEQETPRPLLTAGEVLQLPADDALVMVSGTPPIRAKKLQYFKDRNFIARQRSAPVLIEGSTADAPPARTDDWSGHTRTIDLRLAKAWSDLVTTPADDDDRPNVINLRKRKPRHDHHQDLPLFGARVLDPDPEIDPIIDPPADDIAGTLPTFPGGIKLS